MTASKSRDAPIEMNPEEFASLGHDLVDDASSFLKTLSTRPVTRGETPSAIRKLLKEGRMPLNGSDPNKIIKDASKLIFEHSLFNGHPRFFGYITSSPAPIGALADMLAAVVNPNVGAYSLSPVATEIELQTIRWLAEMVGYDSASGGLLVSGGNMANLVAFLVARTSKTPWVVQKEGIAGGKGRRLVVYASRETHNWILKAADLFGLGLNSIHWVPVDENGKMMPNGLKKGVKDDLRKGRVPFLAVGTAGTVQTGAVDPLPEIAEVCKEYNLWFHVDGAYGAFAAILPNAPEDLEGVKEADSLALDPHKWLYSPLEAGCVLIKKEELLRKTFSHHSAYYRFEKVRGEEPTNFYELGPQNSRGFRALKVWLALKQVGLKGYRKMLSDDVKLARQLYELVGREEELEAFTHNLSITTFRYVPRDIRPGLKRHEKYLNKLNSALLERLQIKGEVFPSNAVIGGKFALRCCIVNFRTSQKDIEAIPEIVVREGRKVDSELRGRR
jgi:glutamate/tyrosine decarboxylase-like PLP-dependent enzyme